MNEKFNPDKGSDFDGFLKREGIYEEVMASPKVKKAIRCDTSKIDEARNPRRQKAADLVRTVADAEFSSSQINSGPGARAS